MVHLLRGQLFPFRHLGVGSLAAALLQGLLCWQERSSQRRHLAGLEDRLLRDVGLSRADIDQEVRKPFWQG